eukprot:GHVS01034394.1.p1 GENE.GHVS01034394.1~~GHVS01034394.1.p1  ORF type:complete len:428 (-),score=48.78 GHVS01034394.1:120-1403(-)
MTVFYFLPYFLWLSPWGSRDSRQGGNLLGVGAELAGQHDERVNEEMDASPQENFLHPPRLLTLGNGASTPASNNPVAAIPVAADPKPEDAQKPSQSADTLDADFSAMVENIVTESEHPPKGAPRQTVHAIHHQPAVAAVAPKPLGPQEAMQKDEEALVRRQAKNFYRGKLTTTVKKFENMEKRLSRKHVEALRELLVKHKSVAYCVYTGPGAPDIGLEISPTTRIFCLTHAGAQMPAKDSLPTVEGWRWQDEGYHYNLFDKRPNYPGYLRMTLQRDGPSAERLSPVDLGFDDVTSHEQVCDSFVFRDLSINGGDTMQKMSQIMFEAFRPLRVSLTALTAAIFCCVQKLKYQFEDMTELFAEISVAFMHGVTYESVYHNDGDTYCQESYESSRFIFFGYHPTVRRRGAGVVSQVELAKALDNIKTYNT